MHTSLLLQTQDLVLVCFPRLPWWNLLPENCKNSSSEMTLRIWVTGKTLVQGPGFDPQTQGKQPN